MTYSRAQMIGEIARLAQDQMAAMERYAKRKAQLAAKRVPNLSFEVDHDPLCVAATGSAKTCAALITGLALAIQTLDHLGLENPGRTKSGDNSHEPRYPI